MTSSCFLLWSENRSGSRNPNIPCVQFLGDGSELTDPELGLRLEEWQFAYNWHRSHSSLGGKTPIERCCELSEQTPLNEEAFTGYDADKELVQERNYKVEMQMRKLKRC